MKSSFKTRKIFKKKTTKWNFCFTIYLKWDQLLTYCIPAGKARSNKYTLFRLTKKWKLWETLWRIMIFHHLDWPSGLRESNKHHSRKESEEQNRKSMLECVDFFLSCKFFPYHLVFSLLVFFIFLLNRRRSENLEEWLWSVAPSNLTWYPCLSVTSDGWQMYYRRISWVEWGILEGLLNATSTKTRCF